MCTISPFLAPAHHAIFSFSTWASSDFHTFHRDRINSVLWRSYYKGGGGVPDPPSPAAPTPVPHRGHELRCSECDDMPDDSQVLIGFLTLNDLSSLQPNTFVNDSVIEAYLQLLADRSSRWASRHFPVPRVGFFSTQFYAHLCIGGYAKVRREGGRRCCYTRIGAQAEGWGGTVSPLFFFGVKPTKKKKVVTLFHPNPRGITIKELPSNHRNKTVRRYARWSMESGSDWNASGSAVWSTIRVCGGGGSVLGLEGTGIGFATVFRAYPWVFSQIRMCGLFFDELQPHLWRFEGYYYPSNHRCGAGEGQDVVSIPVRPPSS